jgi:hypothetical protein
MLRMFFISNSHFLGCLDIIGKKNRSSRDRRVFFDAA